MEQKQVNGFTKNWNLDSSPEREDPVLFWRRMNRMTEWQHKNEPTPPSVDSSFLEWDKY